MATATLKYDYAPQANKLALITNVLVNVSTSSSKALSLEKCFSPTIPRCFGFLLIKFIYSNKSSFSYPRKLIIIELQKLQWAPNNVRNLL